MSFFTTGMIEFLNKQRQKPEHVKKRIAVFTTLGLFSIIFSVWWMSWSTPPSDNAVAISDVVSPLGVVVNAVTGVRSHAEDMVHQYTKQLQYAASGTLPENEGLAGVGAVGTANNGEPHGDVVYPDQVFGSQNDGGGTITGTAPSSQSVAGATSSAD